MDLHKPPTIIGIGVSGYDYHLGVRFKCLAQANYYKILPMKIYLEDSLSTKLSGFVCGFGIGPSLSNKKKTMVLAAYLGFNAGRTTVTKNKFISQKNPFFSPKICIQPKVFIKRLAISLMLEAEYDLSNPAWKQTVFETKQPHLLQPFHQTCYTGVISIGYKLHQ